MVLTKRIRSELLVLDLCLSAPPPATMSRSSSPHPRAIGSTNSAGRFTHQLASDASTMGTSPSTPAAMALWARRRPSNLGQEVTPDDIPTKETRSPRGTSTPPVVSGRTSPQTARRSYARANSASSLFHTSPSPSVPHVERRASHRASVAVRVPAYPFFLVPGLWSLVLGTPVLGTMDVVFTPYPIYLSADPCSMYVSLPCIC